MPINELTEEQLRNAGLNSFRATSGKSFAARFQGSFLYPLFASIAFIISLSQKFMVALFKERFPHLASEEGLLRYHAPVYKVNRAVAAYATGSVTFTGINDSVIPQDSFVVTDEGLRFKTLAQGTIAAGQAIVNVQAENVGLAYNKAINTSLVLETDIGGVDETATISTATTGGVDIEGVESWRARILDAAARKSGTGSNSDVKRWISEAVGAVRAQSFGRYPENGKITITHVTLNPEQIAPSLSDLNTARDYVAARVNDGVIVEILQPAGRAYDLTVRIDPNTAEVQAAITNSLKEWFMLNSKVSVNTGDDDDIFTFPLSQIREAISIAAGESRHELTSFGYNGTPEATELVTVPHGNLASLGSINFISYT